ncbi:hypothetical protein BH23GEM3_BH23GEM3_04910 [soil metagenome]
MDDLSPKPPARWPLLGQAALAGGGLAALSIAGGGLFLQDAAGLLPAVVGVFVTIVTALAVGLWAGAPGGASSEPPVRARWFGAGLTLGAAGVLATFWEIFPILREGVAAAIFALLVLVAAPAYTLGLLLPALLTWAEQREEAAEADSGVWEPLGTLVVGLLGGLAMGVLLAGIFLVPYLGPGPVLLGTAAALLLPTLLPEAPLPETAEQVLYEAESPIGTIRVVEIVYPGQRQPERRLYVNDEEESGELVRSGAPTLPYIAAAEQWLAETATPGDSYLFLGGGAYTLPRRVAERDSGARITVVELDPEVTRTAYRFFGLRRQYGIASVHGDARAYVERVPDSEFDRIFVDVYSGHESLPYSLVTREAFTALERRLHPGGTLALNVIGVTAGEGERRLWSLVRTVRDVFPAVALYTHLGRDYPERQNVLLTASPKIDWSFPAQAGIFERWPEAEWPAAGTIVFRDLFPAEPAERSAPRERETRASKTP